MSFYAQARVDDSQLFLSTEQRPSPLCKATQHQYFNLQYKPTCVQWRKYFGIFLSQKFEKQKTSLIWYPWGKSLYHLAFVYVMEQLQPPFNLFPTAAWQLLHLLGSRNNENFFFSCFQMYSDFLQSWRSFVLMQTYCAYAHTGLQTRCR